MAKPRRVPSRPAVKKKALKPQKPSKPAAKPVARRALGQKPKPRPVPHPPPQTPLHRSTYAEAIATYERGLAAIQRKAFAVAAGILRSILTLYPEEKELHERVRLYLRVCERQLEPADVTPRTPAERVYAATLAVNSGAYDKAVGLASAALETDPSLDNAEYILSVALTQTDKLAQAFVHLRRACELNPENRELARRDVDLEPLRRQEEVRTFLSTSGGQPVRKEKKPVPVKAKGLVR